METLACTNSTLRQGLAKDQSTRRPKAHSALRIRPVALHHLRVRPKRCRHAPIFLWPKPRRVLLAKLLRDSDLWPPQTRVTPAAMPSAQHPLPTASSRASTHLLMDIVGTEALTRQIEHSMLEWQSETGLFMTHMAALESCNPIPSVHRLTICSKVLSKGVESTLVRCTSRAVMVASLMESDEIVRRGHHASVPADTLKTSLVYLTTVLPGLASHRRRACKLCSLGQGRISPRMDRSLPGYEILPLLAELTNRISIGHVTFSLNGKLSLRRFG